MSVFQVFSILSTVMFVLLSVMLSTNTTVGLLLRAANILMALFGFFMVLASSGVVLSGSMRLI